MLTIMNISTTRRTPSTTPSRRPCTSPTPREGRRSTTRPRRRRSTRAARRISPSPVGTSARPAGPNIGGCALASSSFSPPRARWRRAAGAASPFRVAPPSSPESSLPRSSSPSSSSPFDPPPRAIPSSPSSPPPPPLAVLVVVVWHGRRSLHRPELHDHVPDQPPEPLAPVRRGLERRQGPSHSGEELRLASLPRSLVELVLPLRGVEVDGVHGREEHQRRQDALAKRRVDLLNLLAQRGQGRDGVPRGRSSTLSA